MRGRKRDNERGKCVRKRGGRWRERDREGGKMRRRGREVERE